MLTFVICLVLLVSAYFTYGRYLDRVCKINPQASVPSSELYDGVDYVPMPRWRTFLIQLLNIAGTGPIFGAILGACYGPVAFLWITIGGIFMGAMHDYLSGVILVRNDGLSITEIVGRYLGKGAGLFMRVFSVVLLLLLRRNLTLIKKILLPISLNKKEQIGMLPKLQLIHSLKMQI